MTIKEKTNVRIKFPCKDYTIRVVTVTSKKFQHVLESIVIDHDPTFDLESIKVISSRHGNYQSFRFKIHAVGEDQLRELHSDLMSTGIVKLVI